MTQIGPERYDALSGEFLEPVPVPTELGEEPVRQLREIDLAARLTPEAREQLEALAAEHFTDDVFGSWHD